MKTHLSVPYLGGASTDPETGEEYHPRCWAHFTWEGRADRRKIKRHVRAWVLHTLNRAIHTTELNAVCHTRRISYSDGAVNKFALGAASA